MNDAPTRRVVARVDGSAPSIAALHWATALAARTGNGTAPRRP